MPKFTYLAQKPNFPGMGFPGSTLLATIPVLTFYYILLILPFIPKEGNERAENILFWPVAAGLTLTLIFLNRTRVDVGFFRSLPIVSLIAYLVFSAASVMWAYNPEFAFSRLVAQVLAIIVVAAPYTLPIPTKYTLLGLHICCLLALSVSAYFVLTIPPLSIGHPGYFNNKQELGLLAAIGIILASHELLHRGWRRLVALIALGLGFWLVFASESKSALAYCLIAMVASWLMLLLCKKNRRLTPAIVVAAVVVASMFVNAPIERIGYRLYGDSTITGRTAIWAFAEHQISRKPWFGWGFHSYFFVPNSPQREAPGYIGQMPSSHSGYLELKLETGRIGYWIFLVFIYSSLHLLERVRRKAPLRAWCYLSIELFALLINLTDSNWLVVSSLWMVYLFAVVESVHFSVPSKVQVPVQAASRNRAARPGLLIRS